MTEYVSPDNKTDFLNMADKNKRKKLRIGIDIDNVVADSNPSYVASYNQFFNKNVKVSEIDFFHPERSLGVTVEEINEFIVANLHNEDFQMNLDPIKEAAPLIQRWVKKGYEIFYISVRPREIAKVTEDWLTKHGFWVKNARLYTFDASKKYTDIEYKTGIADFEKIDIFIEDKKDIAEGMKIPTFLIDRSWNRGRLPKHVKRVFSWKEIEKTVGEMR